MVEQGYPDSGLGRWFKSSPSPPPFFPETDMPDIDPHLLFIVLVLRGILLIHAGEPNLPRYKKPK